VPGVWCRADGGTKVLGPVDMAHVRRMLGVTDADATPEGEEVVGLQWSVQDIEQAQEVVMAARKVNEIEADAMDWAEEMAEVLADLGEDECEVRFADAKKVVITGRCEKHELTNHMPYDSACEACVMNGMRNRRRVRRHASERIENGVERLCFDLAVYTKQGPYVVIGAMDVIDEDGAPRAIYAAAEAWTRATPDIAGALSEVIQTLQYVWGVRTPWRLHSDGEMGIKGMGQGLRMRGYCVTYTQKYSPASNGKAERAVGVCCQGARIRQARSLAGGTAEAAFRALWAPAVIHAAYTHSAWVGRTTTTEVRVSPGDILPFGSLVIYTTPPNVKPGKDEDANRHGVYLHPSCETGRGSVLAAGTLTYEKNGGTTRPFFKITATLVTDTVRSFAEEGDDGVMRAVFPGLRMGGAKHLRLPRFG
jgi:hypothetical protein